MRPSVVLLFALFAIDVIAMPRWRPLAEFDPVVRSVEEELEKREA